MHRIRLLVFALIACAFASSGAASSAQAGANSIRFGIGDQHTAMFSDPRWQDLGLRLTRYNVPWNAVDDPEALARVIAYVHAARAAGVDPLIHLTGLMEDGRREPLPSRAAYRRAVRALVAVLRPMGVRTWGAWNEANHSSQPTIKSPGRAAEFFLELRAACSGCTVVALDILTQGGPTSKGGASYRGYTQRFFRALGKRRSLVKVVGVHNYGELIENKGPYRSRDLLAFTRRYVPRAQFWLTESGGVAATRTRTCSEARQVTGTQRMFSHAAALEPWGLRRLYMYNWTAHDCEQNFDSGVVHRDGTARPALAVVSRGAARLGR